MEKKFTALRVVSVIFKVLAWIVAVLTVIAFIVMLVGGAAMSSMMGRGYGGYGGYGGLGALGAFGGIGMAFFILIYGAFAFVSLLAAADMILVILAIEENTRNLKPPQTGG